LTFFCSGVAFAGLIIRGSLHLLLKIYYAFFLFSIFIFLYSPSLLFSILSTQKLPEKRGIEFFLADNYYLIKEKSMLNVSDTFVKYKIVNRTGSFNKTIQRNISFNHEIDSIKVLKFSKDKDVIIRGYFSNGNILIDSVEVSSSLNMTDENEISIQRKKK
jgi:hypothetical protein